MRLSPSGSSDALATNHSAIECSHLDFFVAAAGKYKVDAPLAPAARSTAALCLAATTAKYPRCRSNLRLRRGGRVVECTALEMRHTGNRIGGSNPSLSASRLRGSLVPPPPEARQKRSS